MDYIKTALVSMVDSLNNSEHIELFKRVTTVATFSTVYTLIAEKDVQHLYFQISVEQHAGDSSIADIWNISLSNQGIQVPALTGENYTLTQLRNFLYDINDKYLSSEEESDIIEYIEEIVRRSPYASHIKEEPEFL